MTICPCGSSKAFAECCGVYISGITPAPTPETLMRSRYTAYSMANISYIARTMQGPASVDFNEPEAEQWAKEVNWLGLTVLHASEENDRGFVEFIARYAHHNQVHELKELSEFKRVDGRWYYIDGKSPDKQGKKVGRNDPCPCGSNKKFKKCCG